MVLRHPSAAARILALALTASLLPGCASPFRKPAAATPDRAFIQYWGGEPKKGPLRVAVKDLIDVRGVTTTAGSEYLLKEGQPALRDAACLAGVRRSGAQIVGKANLTEFAIGTSGVNEFFGTPINPIHKRWVPGGSSSGSAVTVANGTSDIALGTDTAGSIRVPAACCGISGLKTTFGLISLQGVYPISAKYLDTIGPMARNVEGLVTGMNLLQPGFAGSYHATAPRKWRVGRLYVKGTDRKVDAAVDDALRKAGFEIVVLPESFAAAFQQAQTDAQTVAAASAHESYQRLQGKPGVTVRSKATMLVGQTAEAALPETVARRPQWQATLRNVFSRVDFIALPTLKKLPPTMPIISPFVTLEARVFALQNTQAFNFSGNPALAVPVPYTASSDEWSSLQLVGPMRSEARLLRAGYQVEAVVRREVADDSRKLPWL